MARPATTLANPGTSRRSKRPPGTLPQKTRSEVWGVIFGEFYPQPVFLEKGAAY